MYQRVKSKLIERYYRMIMWEKTPAMTFIQYAFLGEGVTRYLVKEAKATSKG